jgi:hypothetical protein
MSRQILLLPQLKISARLIRASLFLQWLALVAALSILLGPAPIALTLDSHDSTLQFVSAGLAGLLSILSLPTLLSLMTAKHLQDPTAELSPLFMFLWRPRQPLTWTLRGWTAKGVVVAGFMVLCSPVLFILFFVLFVWLTGVLAAPLLVFVLMLFLHNWLAVRVRKAWQQKAFDTNEQVAQLCGRWLLLNAALLFFLLALSHLNEASDLLLYNSEQLLLFIFLPGLWTHLLLQANFVGMLLSACLLVGGSLLFGFWGVWSASRKQNQMRGWLQSTPPMLQITDALSPQRDTIPVLKMTSFLDSKEGDTSALDEMIQEVEQAHQRYHNTPGKVLKQRRVSNSDGPYRNEDGWQPIIWFQPTQHDTAKEFYSRGIFTALIISALFFVYLLIPASRDGLTLTFPQPPVPEVIGLNFGE